MASSLAYVWPVTSGPTVAPALGAGVNSVRVTATLDGSDTTITITHNLGFSTAELAQGQPEVIIEAAAAAGHSNDCYISSKTANTVVLTYLAAAWKANLTIRRPLNMIE